MELDERRRQHVDAVPIWIGKDKYDQGFTFNMAAYDRARYRSHGSVGGFDDVRGVDRLLVFIPGGALVLGQVAVLYSVRRLAVNHPAVNRPALLFAVTALAITFVLTLFPFVWQSLSTSNWQNYYEKQQPPELAHAWVRGRTELYDSWEFVLCAGVGLLGALLAVGLEVYPRREPAPLPDIPGGRVELS